MCYMIKMHVCDTEKLMLYETVYKYILYMLYVLWLIHTQVCAVEFICSNGGAQDMNKKVGGACEVTTWR